MGYTMKKLEDMDVMDDFLHNRFYQAKIDSKELKSGEKKM